MHVSEGAAARGEARGCGSLWCAGDCGCCAVAGVGGARTVFSRASWAKTPLAGLGESALGGSTTLSVLCSPSRLPCAAAQTYREPDSVIPSE